MILTNIISASFLYHKTKDNIPVEVHWISFASNTNVIMVYLTQNFTLEELIASPTAKMKGINNTPNARVIESLKHLCEEILQPIRNKFGKPITVTSGYRCRTLNNVIRGSKTSQHLTGEAADLICSDNSELWHLIVNMIQKDEIKVGQLIDEKNLRWIHVSMPNTSHSNQILHL